eukprot:GILI01027670.1.p1 GENE.GILI01027670.1~~GILI01027670.1.p1  ORF type:complete len:257 (-),score=56.12 GILI01027670.1:40-783(-)
MESFDELSDVHQEELRRFSQFLKTKRDQSLREVDAVLKEFKSDRIVDDVFSAEEVAQLLNDFASTLRSTLQTELQMTSRMSSVFVRKLFSDAQRNNIVIQGDVTNLENAKLLEDAARIESLKPGSISSSSGISRLQPLAQTKEFNNDPSVIAQVQELSSQLAALSVEHQRTQKALQEVESEKMRLLAQSEGLSEEQKRLMAEHEKKMNESAQFQQMRKLLQQKNQQLQELRSRLNQYEPDSTEIQDD